jgi:hypothetical protein
MREKAGKRIIAAVAIGSTSVRILSWSCLQAVSVKVKDVLLSSRRDARLGWRSQGRAVSGVRLATRAPPLEHA